YELCYSNGVKSVLGVTDARLEACAAQYGDDSEDRYYALKEKEEKLQAELDELNNRNDNSDAHWNKIDALEKQLQDLHAEMEPLEQAEAERTQREWELATNEVRK
ncbi:FlxA-like family protein, partial [Shewanella sp. A25]|nr:FlxA-like family protein [Shewanella shenzhenensis]